MPATGRPPLLLLVALWILLGPLVGCGGGEPGASNTPTLAPTPTPVPTATPVPTPTPVPTATPVPTSTPVPTPAPIDCVSEIPVRFALGQLLMPLAEPAQLEEVAGQGLRNEIGWVALLGSPTAGQLAAVATTASEFGGIPLWVASDEEGGRVQRLRNELGPLPSAVDLARRTPAEIQATISAYGRGMAALGVTLAFAPVVDVGGGPGIGDRAFSDDPDEVIAAATSVIAGFRAAGVVPTLKHFPGHGKASGDTHLGFATTPPIDELRAEDLLPFEALLDDDLAVMVGHLLVPGLTEDLPTSLSPAAIDGLLRGELGFDGLVITDALGMGAVSQRWSNAEAARLALVAGADVLILEATASVVPVLDALEAALGSGTLTRAQVDDSVIRVLRHKGVDPCALVSGA